MLAAMLILLSCSIAAMEILLGGGHAFLSIPCYALLAFAGMCGAVKRRKANLSESTILCLCSSAVFFGYVLLRGLSSEVEYIARSDIYIVLAALIVYLTFALFLTASRTRVQFVSVVLVSGFANSIVGGIQFFRGHNFMPLSFLPRSDYGARASGFYGCPNHLAGLLIVTMLLALGLAFWSRYRIPIRLAAGYLAVTSAVGILLTGSRGGYASAVVGLITFGFVSLLLAGKWLRREFWIALVATLLLAGGGIGFGIRSAIQESEFLQFRVASVNLDSGVRKALSKAAIQQFQISPWFGTGSRTYLYYGRQFRHPLIQADPEFAHNDYAQLLAEYGLVGAAGIAFFLIVHVRNAWKSISTVAAPIPPAERVKLSESRMAKGSRFRSAWRAVANAKEDRPETAQRTFKGSNSLALLAASISSVAAYAVHSLVDFNLHIPANACLMAFTFAILANPGINPPSGPAEDGEDSTKLSAFLRWVPCALGVWLSISAIPKWPAEYYSEKAKRLLSDWQLLVSPDIANEAARLSKRGLGIDTENPELFCNLGDSQAMLATQAENPALRRNLYEEAIASFHKAIELAPHDVRYVICLAWALDAIDRLDEAEATYGLALELDPNSASLHRSYAVHSRKRGELERAEAEFVRALALGFGVPADSELKQVRAELAAKKLSAPATSSMPP